MENQEEIYGFQRIHLENAEEIMRREKAWLIDIRDEQSYREGHMKKARNLPFEYIDDWSKRLPERVSVILYCEHGNQSMLAARRLRGRKGKIYTIIGGYADEKKIDTAEAKS